MSPDGQKILGFLQDVAAHRAAHVGDTVLSGKVRAVKAYQHARFAATYADLLASPRYGPAASFFLNDLYGPHDFAERDGQFVRIVPALVRLFPDDIVHAVVSLAELHALSEELDSLMATVLDGQILDTESYAQAWRKVGRPEDREKQIQLMLKLGLALDGFTRKPLLRHSLRLMRVPASAAGLGALQRFLERGFDTFREMRGPQVLLDNISQRERALAAELFSGANSAD